MTNKKFSEILKNIEKRLDDEVKFKIAIGIGFVLGMFALLIFSFYLEIRQINIGKMLDRTETEHLVGQIKGACHKDYDTVTAAIYRGKIVIRCQNLGDK